MDRFHRYVLPRAFEDYEVKIDEANMPAGVTMIRRVG